MGDLCLAKRSKRRLKVGFLFGAARRRSQAVSSLRECTEVNLRTNRV